MGLNVVFTLAVGDKTYGSFALNWVLSVNNARPQAKTMLIYEPSAVEENEELLDSYFDYKIEVRKNPFKTGHEYAFKLKTELYDLVKHIEADNFLFIDSDTIILPRASVDEWFDELKGVKFTSWCNDIYDFSTSTRMRGDYTFWCDENKIGKTLAIQKLPQINSSFLYFAKHKDAKMIFDTAKEVWDDDKIKFKSYKGVKPDEFCFNIALAVCNFEPHQIPYYPIFFQFASENHEIPYIHEWKAMGFAGDGFVLGHFLGMYNELAYHYRKIYGIENWQLNIADKSVSRAEYLELEPKIRRTIYRRGELPNSGGGVFNPDAIISKDGTEITIFRKEIGRQKDMYIGASAIPHTVSDKSLEHIAISFPTEKRIEDFRLFAHNDSIFVNHSIVDIDTTSNLSCKCAISILNNKYLTYIGVPNLPIKTNVAEKNWVFFSEGERLWCIYSLQPYKIFYTDDLVKWNEYFIKSPELNWFHDSFICNSTNPILIDDSYLMFFHTKSNGIYYHGALLIDAASKQITHYTKNPLQIKSWGEGLQKDLIFVSGSLYLEKENIVRVYYGESDSHSCSNDYDKDALINEIKKITTMGMRIGKIDVQPIMLYVPDSEKWMKRFEAGKKHFAEVGIENIITVPAIYGEGFGIEGTHEYNLDNPNGHHKIGIANTSLFLSMYMVYNIELNLPNSHFFFLEDDSRFNEGFLEKINKEIKNVPDDFDFLFVGSCCAVDKNPIHVAGDVYEFKHDHNRPDYPSQYPMGGNAYIIAKKAIPKIIETQRDAYANVDISLAIHTFKYLKVYGILPRLCEQHNNNLPL